jgi:hypothetical protein
LHSVIERFGTWLGKQAQRSAPQETLALISDSFAKAVLFSFVVCLVMNSGYCRYKLGKPMERVLKLIGEYSIEIDNMRRWLPKWDNSSAYDGFGEGTTIEQWAWEFLRRNPYYNRAWDKWFAISCELCGRSVKSEDTADLEVQFGEIEDCLKCYGIADQVALCHPSKKNAPKFFTNQYPRIYRFDAKTQRFRLHDTGVVEPEFSYKPMQDHDLGAYISYPSEIIVMLSLYEDINGQLGTIRRECSKIEAELEYFLVPRAIKKVRNDKYVYYLRILDAFYWGVTDINSINRKLRSRPGNTNFKGGGSDYEKTNKALGTALDMMMRNYLDVLDLAHYKPALMEYQLGHYG